MDWKRNYHTHTDFCDGQNTPEEMAEAAAKKDSPRWVFPGIPIRISTPSIA